MNEDLDIKRFELAAKQQEQQELEHRKFRLHALQLLDEKQPDKK